MLGPREAFPEGTRVGTPILLKLWRESQQLPEDKRKTKVAPSSGLGLHSCCAEKPILAKPKRSGCCQMKPCTEHPTIQGARPLMDDFC